MAWLSKNTVQAVKEFQNIINIIQEYVELKKRGRNYIGLCPFHNEKTPSFTVSPEKKIFHCFGCHESGDLITFIQKIDNLTFLEAIEKIANKVGIKVEYDTSKPTKNHSKNDQIKEKVQTILYSLQSQFSKLLQKNPTVINYLKNRGINNDTINTFQIGYAAPQFNILKWCEENNSTTTEIQNTGIFFRTDQGEYRSRFKNRIIFPIIDHINRTVGFGGRIFELNQKGAKYINSEESLLFNKRNVLYGIQEAKTAIKKQQCVILVEGYMDVLLCHQYGIKNTVAIMGTALTNEQILKIKRYTSSILLCLDNDGAGQTAIEKSCELLLQSNCKVKIITLDAKDPADFLLSQGRELFESKINNAIQVLDFIISQSYKKWDNTILDNIPVIINFVTPYLRAEKERIIQNHYVQKMATTLNIEPELILAKIEKNNYNIKSNFSLIKNTKKSKNQKAEEFLIVFASIDLKLREKIFKVVKPEQFSDPLLSKIALELIKSNKINSELLESIKIENLKKELSQLILKADALKLNNPSEEEYNDYINLMINNNKEEEIKKIKNQLKEFEKEKNETKMAELLQKLHQIKIN